MGSMKHQFTYSRQMAKASQNKGYELSCAVDALKRIATLAADFHNAKSHDRSTIVDAIGILARRMVARIEPPKPVPQLVTVREFLAYVASRGYQANPALDGQPLKVVGYELVGPCRNRKVVRLSPEGLLPLFEAELWCDGIEDAAKRPGRR